MRFLACVSFAFTLLMPFVVCVPSVSARPLEIADMRAIVDVEEPAMTRDGSQIAFVTIRADRNALDVVRVDGTNRREIASGGSVAVPRWSPDSRQLAYLF
jgi:hypothetical protein